MSAPFRFVSTNRRVREDRRFVVGRGNYVADIKRDGMLHVAIVPSAHAAARIVSIDATAALALPGVHHVLTGEELSRAVEPMMNGLDTPHVRRYSLAVGQARYSGEWVAAVVADSRAVAEDAAELIDVACEPLPHVVDVEHAATPSSPLVHPAHGSNVLLDRTFVWGEVERHFAEAPRQLSFRVTWGRNSTVPIETFGVLAAWDPWHELLDVWASIQMPKYNEQIARALRLPANAVRVHYDVDVGG
ncbi:MAG: xanthine dehydrogenase family protein molybdopterin-binding subunit, partial [Alphaproteobacteria bacterium]|nr:xanthine dehydrogenase family protein molybdopterin-binding subunit [Alphaproteobacteria bacterium]